MKTCLVTGGAGFIGSNFVLHVLAQHEGIQVVTVDKLTYAGDMGNLTDVADDSRHVFVKADICDTDAMREVLEMYRPRCIVNFAAESHVDRSIAAPLLFAGTNVLGAVSLLDAARMLWERADGSYPQDVRFLQVSTDEVYGSLSLDGSAKPFSENAPLVPSSPYSASKAAADMFVHSYGATYGMPVNIVRCSNNYGPRQYPEKLIPLVIGNALEHRRIPLYGDGLNVRDWLYVEDCCRAIDLVLEKASPGKVYNIGAHEERANVDVVRLLLSKLSRAVGDTAIDEGLVEHVADRRGHDRRYAMLTGKIERDLGWKPQVAFDEGISRTVRWYVDSFSCFS